MTTLSIILLISPFILLILLLLFRALAARSRSSLWSKLTFLLVILFYILPFYYLYSLAGDSGGLKVILVILVLIIPAFFLWLFELSGKSRGKILDQYFRPQKQFLRIAIWLFLAGFTLTTLGIFIFYEYLRALQGLYEASFIIINILIIIVGLIMLYFSYLALKREGILKNESKSRKKPPR